MRNADYTEFKVGARVAYEDMANPRREGTIIEIALALGGQFVIRWDNGAIDLSDCRQAGWSLIPSPAEGLIYDREGNVIGEKSMSNADFLAPLAPVTRNLRDLNRRGRR
jgi:hypothetical protein